MNRNKKTYDKNKRGNKYSKGKDNNKRGPKPYSKEEASDVADNSNMPTQDAEWYFIDPEVAEQASRLSFNGFLGINAIEGKQAVPTVMLIGMNPSIDPVRTSSAKYSGIDLAMNKLYTRLSITSGRTTTYQPSDLGMLLLQMGELISNIEYVRRLFGVSYVYNTRNRVYPKGIIGMMGIDEQDFFSHQADYRMKFNYYITQLRQIPIPVDIGYLKKCEALYQNVFLDSASPMAQSYVLIPTTTWIIDETVTPPVLKTVPVTGEGKLHLNGAVGSTIVERSIRTLQDYFDKVLGPMVNNLLTSSTFNIIYADILNYVTKSNVKTWQFDYLAETYAVLPVYSEKWLEIIHNMRITGATLNTNGPLDDYNSVTHTHDNDVSQIPNANRLMYDPLFTNWEYIAAGQSTALVPVMHGSETAPTVRTDPRILTTSNLASSIVYDVHDPAIDPKRRIDIMRYQSLHAASTLDRSMHLPDHYITDFTIFFNDECYYTQIYCPSISDAWFCSRKKDGTAFVDGNLPVTDSYNTFAGQAPVISVTLGRCLPVFDWAPIFYQDNNAPNASYYSIANTELDFFTTMDREQWSRINDLVYLGLFDLR